MKIEGVFGAMSTVVTVVRQKDRGKDTSHLAWSSPRTGVLSGINADLLFKRLWIGGSDAATVDHLGKVATACKISAALLDALQQRRAAAARYLAAADGHTSLGLEIRPVWRMVIGHGEDTAQETSLTLSPTYGVPIIPGSALKGVAAAQARADHPDGLPPEITRLFGALRRGERRADPGSSQGRVTVLDALPIAPPAVVVDVLTPHVKPYYDSAGDDHPTTPPAEYHSPVPVRFLAVQRTSFLTWLVGPAADVNSFAGLLRMGANDLGLGGKTAAGYGYCEVRDPS